MKKLLQMVLGAMVFAAGAQAQVTNLWNDQAPVGGTMNLAASNVGGAHGNVGVFTSSTSTSTNEISTYSITGQDWSAFAGLGWTLTADIYITSAQLADGAIAEDTISCTVGGVASSSVTLSNAVWWTPDAWNTVYFTGTFGTSLPNLSSTSAAFVNNDKNNDPAGSNYLIDNISLDVGVLQDVLWDDQNPTGGNMLLTSIADPFATGHGNIGQFTSTANAQQWQNYNTGAMNLSAYAGRRWKSSIDVYLTTAQLTNSAIADDNLYFDFAGTASGWTTISNAGWVADSWNTLVWSGTLPANAASLTAANFIFVINDQNTHPASGPNAYFDNFKLEVESAPQPPKDTLWTDTAPQGGNALITLTNDLFATGHGDIGVFNSASSTNQWTSFGTSGNNWTNYGGQSWTMSFDLYITAAQLADANIADDQIYYSVAGVAGGWKSLGSSGLTPDAWNKITWNGAFAGDGSTLTNVTVQLVINDQLTDPASGDNFYVDNFKFEAATPVAVVEMDILWSDSNPASGNMALVSLADPFATGHGNIGMFESDTDGGQYSNYGLSGKDLGAYVGQDWILSADVYITAAQLADALITDDTIYCQVGGAAGGYTSVSSLSPDAWNTLTWTGTFTNSALALANSGGLFVNNDNATHPVAGKNYFVDNFLLKAVTPVTTNPPPIYIYQTNDVEFVAGEGYSDGALNNQQGWKASANWIVNTASGGSVVCTNDNANMTLVQLHPLGEGTTMSFSVNYKVQGTHVPVNWRYPARIGITSIGTGANIGYDAAGNSLQSAVITLQSAPATANGYRIFGDGWNGPQSAIATGTAATEWALHFSLTMGSAKENTSFTASLENVTTATTYAFPAPETDGVGDTLYAALASGAAYPFFNTGGFQDGLTGIEVLGFTVVYPVEIADQFVLWAEAKGLSGANAAIGADPDQDGLINLGEYILGGDPHAATGADDQGIQPVLDGFTYKFSLIGDPFVVGKVLTTSDLAYGPWTVSDTVNVSADDGQMHEYTFDASGQNVFFLKIEATRDL